MCYIHCLKGVRVRSYSGPYFLAFSRIRGFLSLNVFKAPIDILFVFVLVGLLCQIENKLNTQYSQNWLVLFQIVIWNCSIWYQTEPFILPGITRRRRIWSICQNLSY